MSNFVWETEEDQEKEWPNPETEAPVETPSSPARKWLFLLPAVALVIVTALVIYNQIQRRIADTEAAMTADIISTFDLVQLAAVEQDDELLTPLLSGRDLDWVNAQLDSAAGGTLLDRPNFGLQLMGEPMIQPNAAVFNERLDAAELTIQQPYQDPYGNTITLEHTLQFREGANRWLWSPLEGDYWGETITTTGPRGYLSLSYPERDADIIDRLAPNLEQQVAILCTDNGTLELPCDGLTVHVDFETDPAVLIDPHNSRIWLQTDGRVALTLPTPSLLGRPTDTAGYTALTGAYAAPIITQLIAEQSGYTCCADGWAMAAVIDQYLAKAQLRPEPLTAADYGRFFSEPFIPTSFTFRIQLDEQDEERERWRTALVLDFALAQTNLNLGELLPIITTSTDRWLDGLLLLASYSPDEAYEELLSYAYTRQQPHPAALQTPLPPNQSLLAVCSQTSDLWPTINTIQQFDLQTETWTAVTSPLDNTTSVAILPDDTGLLWTNSQENGRFTFVSQYDSQITTLYQTAEDQLVYFSNPFIFDQDQYLNFYFSFSFSQDGSEESPSFGSIDTEACQNGACELNLSTNYRFHSPDGRYLATVDNQQVQLSNSAGELIFSGNGSWPVFWLNSEVLIYGGNEPPTETTATMTLYQADASTGQASVFVSTAQIDAATPYEDDNWDQYGAYPHPQNEALLFLFYGRQNSSRYVIYNWRTEEIIYKSADVIAANNLHVPANGRWLLFDSFDTSLPDIVINTSTYEQIASFKPTNPFSQSEFSQTYDWSADGEWLAVFHRGYALLYAPATNDYYPILYDDLSHHCVGGGWQITSP